MTTETKDFLKSQLDKLLLVFLIVYFTLFMIILLLRFPNLDGGTLQWIEKSVDMATGAIIGAVTTSAVIKRSDTTIDRQSIAIAVPPPKEPEK